MRFLLVLLVLIFAVPLTAHGAAPELCRPYADRVSQALVTFAWNRSYSVCTNSDEVPNLPADWLAALAVVNPDATPIQPLDRADVAGIKAVAEVVPAAPTAPAADPDWLANCRRKAPASFDAASGTFIRPHTHKRTPCPR